MKNPKMLTLLEHGCTIRFPSGYEIGGDVQSMYIDLRFPDGTSDGLWNLDREGLVNALKDERKYLQSLKGE